MSKLTSQGHSVRVLTRNPNAASGKLPYPRVEVFGPQRWNEAVKGSTVVINLAGMPHVCFSRGGVTALLVLCHTRAHITCWTVQYCAL